MKKIIATLLLTSFFFTSCEKDDICDPSTPTTPQLVVQFFDKNNISLTRKTTNLKIVGDGMQDNNPLLNPNGGQTWNDTILYLPLRVNENATKFKLIMNANDNNDENDIIDYLEFNYTRKDVYISRACGFKTLFDLYGDPLRKAFLINDNPNTNSGNWINNIQVMQSQINDENETHIKIFF
ncbi:DUF6452 family protein [Flavobacterium sp.]|uniref:DUF6452 family protein n=1 Tax=Flavobacterium sp. TaxID=239 RepID=UPI0026328AB1|nr:DUF6452 family protein [Flavobacterium sp.]MDD3003850.1 DUF6452 family protein [Flavobacterium sp.]